MLRRVITGFILLGAVACATPRIDPIQAGPLVPGARERIVVEQIVLIVDSSGSISGRSLFPQEKALVESFAGAMPEGRYSDGAIAFGGLNRQSFDLQPHRMGRIAEHAAALQHLDEGTPLDTVLLETKGWLEGQRERAAVVVFSDGVPTDIVGRDIDSERVMAAAQDLAGAYAGTVCFHTVQIGNEPAGADLLRRLAGITRCGTFRQAGSVHDVASLNGFEREVFLGAKPAAQPKPKLAAAPTRDTDGDGVVDPSDACPATPGGARVDARGCWIIQGLNFATNSDAIEDQYAGRLDDVIGVLKKNPGLRVRIDGHTDSRGSDSYNRQLSEKRARSVREYLVAAGADPGLLESKGWGEAKPAYPNDTPQNMRANRRTELTAVR